VALTDDAAGLAEQQVGSVNPFSHRLSVLAETLAGSTEGPEGTSPRDEGSTAEALNRGVVQGFTGSGQRPGTRSAGSVWLITRLARLITIASRP